MSEGLWKRLLRALGLLRSEPPSAPRKESPPGKAALPDKAPAGPPKVAPSKRPSAPAQPTLDEGARPRQKARVLDPARLVFPDGGSAGKAYFVIGLDFGTSCSKVVIRGLFVGAERAYAVPLAQRQDEPYLLPTQVFRNDRGEYSLSGSAGAERLADLKVRLLVAPADRDAQRNVSIYLGLVLRGARDWFLRTQETRYGKFELIWSANVGVPSAGYDDDDIQQAFLEAAAAGWLLSTVDSALTNGHLDDAWAKVDAGPIAPVTVIPEVVAAAAGYARSKRARSGMHLMLDVGASTLDLCGFALINDANGQRYELYSTVVEHLGAAVLHMDRVRALDGNHDLGSACQVDPRDPKETVPDELRPYVGHGVAVPDALLRVDEKFAEDCAKAARTALVQTWKKNPLSLQWDEGLPVFLCGGGARIRLYKQLVDQAVAQHGNYAWSKLRTSPLELPADLEPLGNDGSRLPRMVVAYGLSFSSVNLEGLVRPQDIPNVPPPPRRRMDDRYVSKDMV
jgi:hypothetical protein